MRGKTVVIIGGTSGIGEVAAIALGKMGARIILVARDCSAIRLSRNVERAFESVGLVAIQRHCGARW
jgi:NAD(P)-dependent dehydrogenase (short-subunit alcohol dehydrogenase family)